MITKKIFMCEDSVDGIFTAIYDAWDSRYGHDNVRIQVQGEEMELELFSEYIDVGPDEEKIRKVARSIKEKISEEAFDMVCKAAWSHEKNKGDVIYRFLILGFHIGSKVINLHSNDTVIKMFNMNRNVFYETHHFLGFIRFTESKNHILFSKINPKNDILRLIAPHFSDRLNNENFIIYDEKRKSAIVHRSGYPWIFTYANELDVDKLSNLSPEEEEFRALWQTFFDTIGIEERKNYRLQRNNLPKRFRSNMVEFNTQD
ncbi:putative DNA metabolism protein [Mobilisporobacter senegalensis]|uniref:Putative DNA metabolism protein n=1 Tax=Mobilisporobacter senegalensis TaxID=1329262 RepID=A0A3N1XHZ8_9FIRM|nr:TIGR03915 family putative DNA repair protein [Mobilisporobacter senegalensis]ROR26366.1 putative DNA metabolism protein [Mobilisporobacter senegalensis]